MRTFREAASGSTERPLAASRGRAYSLSGSQGALGGDCVDEPAVELPLVWLVRVGRLDAEPVALVSAEQCVFAVFQRGAPRVVFRQPRG